MLVPRTCPNRNSLCLSLPPPKPPHTFLYGGASLLYNLQGIQMYNLSFDQMSKMLFKGERTQKQLKKKFEKEMREHPEMVHRALRTQITKGEEEASALFFYKSWLPTEFQRLAGFRTR